MPTPQTSGQPVPPVPPVPPQPPLSGTPLAPAPAHMIFTLDMLRARGAELSNQLRSAQNRRDELAREMRRVSTDARAGMQPRLDVLDNRLVQLEKDIEINGQLIAQAAASEAAQPPSSALVHTPIGDMTPGNVTAVSIVFTLFVLCPMAIAAARLMWKRGNRAPVTGNTRASEQRLERVEQAVDTIAVEIERISEGQRFVTQLLSRAHTPELGAGQQPAEPVRVPLNETVMSGVARKAAG